MYYNENLQLAEISACFGLTEREIAQIRAETIGLLQTYLFRDLEQQKRMKLDGSSFRP
jgi:DNA-directed RNA polymerase specialized sigma subunit